MRKIINRIFSDKYVNHNAVVGNSFLLVMYRFAYPFAVLLNKLHLSPNQITTQSLAFSILAFLALVYDEGWVWFTIFWGMTVLLDFCDGTVARMTDKVSKSAFRYDHMSDLFKITLVILGIGLRYDNDLVWGVIFITSFVFLYSDILNYQLEYASRKNVIRSEPIIAIGDQVSKRVRLRDRFRIAAWISKYDILVKALVNVYSALLTVNGHTLLVFLLVPLSREYALYACLYFIFVSVLAIRSNITVLIKMPR